MRGAGNWSEIQCIERKKKNSKREREKQKVTHPWYRVNLRIILRLPIEDEVNNCDNRETADVNDDKSYVSCECGPTHTKTIQNLRIL